MKLPERKNVKGFDWLTLAIIVCILAMGLLAMINCTADPSTSDMTIGAKLASLDLYYPILQLAWFCVGLVVVTIMSFMDYQVLTSYVKLAYAFILGLLVFVLIFGSNQRGVTGWFTIGSARAFQPAELGKVVLIMMLAKLCSDSMGKHEGRLRGVKDISVVAAVTAVPVVLICLQPDWGSAFVYICIMVGIMFAARMSWKVMAASVLTAAVGLPLAYYFLLTTDQQNRIIGYLNPDADTLGITYHANVGEEVIRSGGATGKGFLQEGSLTQLGYLPEKHTDYIFASLVEAVGFIGGVILILLFFALLIRTLYVATKARDNFGMLLCVGAASMVFAHMFENIAMLIGLMPITGIPLPFVSYGGSNMLTNMITYGLVINVWIRRQQKRKY